jgi:MOSC domain-containing protein YiiM
VTTLGPYEFVGTDVETTVQAGWALFDQLELRLDQRRVAVVEPYRLRAEAMLDGVLACEADLDDALGVLWREWRDAMVALREAGAFGPSAVGTVTDLFRSDGGVPKHPVEAVTVGYAGVDGDRQSDRHNHGRPFQALCIWSTEVIDAFRAEGHPLAPGLAGENITLTGIDWQRMIPGVRLQISDVLVELSSFSVPCRKNAAWFVDGHFGVMHHRHGPVSRLYATVLEPGRIAVGDPVLLEPRS